MKPLVIVFASLILTVSAATDEELWNEFKLKHSKTYRSLREEKLRYDIFQSTLRIIDKHNARYNAGVETYYMGINQFSDLTDEEFRRIYLNTKMPQIITSSQYKLLNLSLPDEVDWRSTAVVEVKDQIKCGSCWAFSATGAMEGQYAIKYDSKLSLSEQELLDCSHEYGNQGCDGGLMNLAFNYVRDHGISTEAEYAYLGKESKCKNTRIQRSSVKISGHVAISKSEDDLQEAVATIGPISAAISGDSIKNYMGGIYNNKHCSQTMNHGVLVVGYGFEGNREYWLIKNSWGPHWGEDGYIRMARNNGNQCGISSECSYPIVE